MHRWPTAIPPFAAGFWAEVAVGFEPDAPRRQALLRYTLALAAAIAFIGYARSPNLVGWIVLACSLILLPASASGLVTLLRGDRMATR